MFIIIFGWNILYILFIYDIVLNDSNKEILSVIYGVLGSGGLKLGIMNGLLSGINGVIIFFNFFKKYENFFYFYFFFIVFLG